jgi:hypothetical protein
LARRNPTMRPARLPRSNVATTDEKFDTTKKAL